MSTIHPAYPGAISFACRRNRDPAGLDMENVLVPRQHRINWSAKAGFRGGELCFAASSME